ncbi:xanthine dehydrogenase molybdenum binding subunit apoprotein [Humitalea rosea]|uniref:Xanthine dehydrogenase molybdenum binding subunit apoprotein n=1 Tax=Humitalea rosea TaxID=990373 RepID=A0A2W7I5T9_9PROT|nr:xanthine dehydrogenase family protein molybdopterin-binding subunit [Humitalea rosea]PZW40842.1 xanthine dehydrogenase molybdenum binding subunit apoprotein [Humitalea rosea]
MKQDHAGWIGASPLRREDARHLRGQGEFVADVVPPGTLEVVFLRSPVAHGLLRGVTRAAGVVRAADLPPLTLPPAGPDMPGFRQAALPPLATDRVRFVGQPIAACLGATRHAAQDLAASLALEIEELPAITDARAALAPGATLLHPAWADNRYAEGQVRAGDPAGLDAPIRLTRRLRLGRQSVAPMETRGVIAWPDHRTGELVVRISSQGPHTLRHALAATLGMREADLRVIAPDVGGGFGAKNRLMPEEIVVAALARRLGRPVRWIEERSEHFLASPQAREHDYDLTVLAARDGTILGLTGELWVDAGAYALWPTGAFAEAAMAARNLPGPYAIRHLDIRHHTVATNKPPMGPYRGVGRTGACFAIERMVDVLAGELGLDPLVVRARNLIPPSAMPYETAAGMRLDTGDYPAALAACAAMIDRPAIAARQAAGEAVAVGFAIYTEQSGHGVAEWAGRRARVVPGHETATLRMHPDGSLTLLTGIQSHGQGLETVLAQIVATELGLHPDAIAVRHGDTALSPFGFGTFASRSLVFAGGAAQAAARELGAKLRRIGGHLLQAAETVIRDGAVHAGAASIGFAAIAEAAHLRAERLPPGEAPGLDVTSSYAPPEGGGVFSYAAHAATVHVDRDTGAVTLLDYAVAEDCGTVINPTIVDGQVRGGIVQGIGTALAEHLVFDATGQPLATTFAEYAMPRAADLPPIRIAHLVTPALGTVHGAKGMGEGGAIAPPAAIANAIGAALGLEVNMVPATPARVRGWIAAPSRSPSRPLIRPPVRA